MRTVLDQDHVVAFAERAEAAEAEARRTWPGGPAGWQPVHTVYVPADRFDAGTVAAYGDEARRLFERHAPDGTALADATALRPPDPAYLHDQVATKLASEPVEDVRIDFEDGYGVRSDAEEDAHVTAAATTVAQGLGEATLPRRIGVRPKSFADGLATRSLRTLDGFLATLLDATGGALPEDLRITFPKVVATDHVSAFAEALGALEEAHGLAAGRLGFEVQVETPMTVVDDRGGNALRAVVDAGQGRVRAAHLGVFDYTSALGLLPSEQRLDHPACDAVRHVMQTALAGTGVELSDGSTNAVPRRDDAEEVSRVWRTHAGHVTRSWRHGFVQGWDLHPAHLVSRYAAAYASLHEGLDDACRRVRAWRSVSEDAAGSAGVLDEPATIAALVRHLRRAVATGAADLDDLAARSATEPGELLESAARRSSTVSRQQVDTTPRRVR